MATTVLLEDFDAVTDWTATGTAPGRRSGTTGVGTSLSSGSVIAYTIPPGGESDVVTVGFGFNSSSITARALSSLRSDAGVTTHLTIALTATGALEVRRGTATGTVLATSSAGLITASAWNYLELQARLHDTTGFVTLRVNGAQVAAAANVDTRNAGTKSTFDTFVVTNSGVFDDGYVVTGADGAFLGAIRIGTDNAVLEEPFDNLTGWTPSVGGNVPFITPSGRNGSCVQMGGAGGTLTRAIAPLEQSYALVIGFALRCSGNTSTSDFIVLRRAGVFIAYVRCSTSGALTVNGTLAATPTGTILPDGLWRYVEIRLVIGGTNAFTATIRVNGTVVGSAGPGANLGTSVLADNAPDSIEMSGIGSIGGIAYLDDLYLRTGTLADFEGDHAVTGTPTATTVGLWNGTAFAPAPTRLWSGTAFVDAVKVSTWNGTAFV